MSLPFCLRNKCRIYANIRKSITQPFLFFSNF
uniref:Uncharacterized protein n=1 Tax=Rhizophora mucronata TaxID=61149 RepID=A0A2P2QB55_RHIMU